MGWRKADEPPGNRQRMFRARGYLFALTSAAIGGTTSTLGKLALPGLDPLMLSGVVALIAAGFALPLAPRIQIAPGDLPGVLAISLLGGMCGPALFYFGLGLTTATSAVILVNSEILFTILIATALGERANTQEWAALGILAAGAVIVTTNLDVSTGGLLNGLGGNALLLLSYLAFGFDNNISKGLSQRNNPLQLVWMKFLIGGAVLTALSFGNGLRPSSSPPDYLPVLALSAVYVGGTWSFYMALGKIGAMCAIAIFSTNALFGVIVAAVVLKDTITTAQALGGGLMGIGVVIVALNEQRRLAAQTPSVAGEGLPVSQRR